MSGKGRQRATIPGRSRCYQTGTWNLLATIYRGPATQKAGTGKICSGTNRTSSSTSSHSSFFLFVVLGGGGWSTSRSNSNTNKGMICLGTNSSSSRGGEGYGSSSSSTSSGTIYSGNSCIRRLPLKRYAEVRFNFGQYQ